MESTKVVSLRIDRNRYDEILLFCSKRRIPFSEWLEGRLLIADNSDEIIIQIREIIEEAIDNIDHLPAAAKRKLNSLLRSLDKM
jgi:hypothetical protein